MSTYTVYVPTEVSLKEGAYLMNKSYFVGNFIEATKRIKELRKEFPKPNYVVRRLGCEVQCIKENIHTLMSTTHQKEIVSLENELNKIYL